MTDTALTGTAYNTDSGEQVAAGSERRSS